MVRRFLICLSVVVCLLEVSGKWPEDREAIRRLKAAFYLRVGKLLEDQHGLMTASYADHVDVYKVTILVT